MLHSDPAERPNIEEVCMKFSSNLAELPVEIDAFESVDNTKEPDCLLEQAIGRREIAKRL